ncbi:MAG: hypothetical protein LIP01_14335 [Tannerellaceae bacterium]|nr:hypothetical protein [Tannerellaceae bacterium]
MEQSVSDVRYWIHQLSERENHFLIHVLLPGDAVVVLAYATGIERQRIKGALQGKAGRDFRQLKWEFIYTVLATTRRHVFNKKYFVETTLLRISRHYNVSVQELLCFFCEDRKMRNQVLPFDLIKILDELYKWYGAGKEAKEEQKKAEDIVNRYFNPSILSSAEKEMLLQAAPFLIEALPVLKIEQSLYAFIKKEFAVLINNRNRLKHWLELSRQYGSMRLVEWLDSILRELFRRLSVRQRWACISELKNRHIRILYWNIIVKNILLTRKFLSTCRIMPISGMRD